MQSIIMAWINSGPVIFGLGILALLLLAGLGYQVTRRIIFLRRLCKLNHRPELYSRLIKKKY
ncbi:MAG: hypothetical protein D6B26_03220, partial [Spirochaetaceae bacterium]